MKFILRLLREPLFQFFALGGMIYVGYVATSDAPKAPADHIVITPRRIAQISTQFSSVWKRAPTRDEMNALIEGDIREEVYYRDALALGLDRNDAIVRRRLRQKMEFLTDTSAYLKEPSTDELEAYLAANEKAYRHEPRLTFEQVYLGTSPTKERIAVTMSALRANPAVDLASLGEPTLLPTQLSLSQPNAVDGTFGKGFFERIAKFSPNTWNGPVQSGYGMHLVRVVSLQPARTPKLDDVRAAVLRDWKSAKSKELRERDYATRRKRFVVEIRHPDPQPTKSK